MADFLNAAVRGQLSGFKSHHRIRTAKHLAARAYSRDRDPERPPTPTPDPYPDTGANTPTPWGTPWKDEWDHFEYPEDRSYDFSSYDEDDYRRDVYGAKALEHIFGDEEAKSVANLAVLDYKVDLIEAQRAAVNSEHDTGQPADPPDDDTFGPHVYGYDALVFIYDSKAAARAGYMAAMDHKEKLRLGLIAADGYGYLDDIEDSGPDPPPHPPPKPRVLAHFGPPGYD